MRPFLKWAGNKYQILASIQSVLAMFPQATRLVEPFVGSGAVFLNTDYPEYHLCDNNPDLISLYQMLQREGQAFIDYCKPFFSEAHNTADAYYEHRHTFNTTPDAALKAALFVYFNKHGFNGLCRYSLKNGFNVPFGRYKKPYFPEAEMQYFAKKARRAVFEVLDFEETLQYTTHSDVVYCDPPYVPLSATAKFTAYSVGHFGVKEQTRLAECAIERSEAGAAIIISNHDTPFTQHHYRGADALEALSVQRYISCNGSKREKVPELLAVFAPKTQAKSSRARAIR